MKDAYIVSYAPQALEDLKGIYAYIAFELQASVTGKKLEFQVTPKGECFAGFPNI